MSSNPVQEKKYPYSDDFKEYLNAVFKEKLKSNTDYFIIPLNSCGQCVDSALYKMTATNFDWIVILVGQTEDSLRKGNILLTKLRHNCLVDSSSILTEYSVSIGIPSLLRTNNSGTVISKTEFTYSSWK